MIEKLNSQRLFLLLKLFLALLFAFMLQKPVFMLCNGAQYSGVSVTDYLSVMWHGIPLDATMCGYVCVVPLVVMMVSFFVRVSLRRWLMPYFAVISLLLSVIFVADTVMYVFWQFKRDTTVFLYTDKPADVLASVSGGFVAATLLAGALVAAGYYALFYWFMRDENESRQPNPWGFLAAIPVGGIMFVVIRGGVGEGTANVSNVYYSDNQYLNHAAVNPAFNIFYSLTHQQDFSSEFQYYDDEKEVERLTAGLYGTESVESDSLLRTDRPDIILVVWEGCGASLAGCLGAEGNVTPNLDKLAAEGILFSNCQSNSFRTDRGLVSVNSGWLGFPSASLMKIPEKCEKLPGLARSLHDNGYSTDFWYGGDISFTNMGGFLLQNGYQKTYGDKDFSAKERTSEWGAPDGALFDKALDCILAKRGRFFTSILTLSSHEPWDVPYRRLEDGVENSFAYTDDCLGKFVERLKASDKWKNTLLIVVPDHGCAVHGDRGRSALDVIRVPLVWAGGAVKEHRVIGTLMNQSDIAATLLGQLHINHDDFVFSRDVMSKSYKVPSAIHCSRVEFTMFDSLGATTYDLDGNMVVNSTDKGSDATRVEKGKAVLQMLYRNAAEL